MVARGDLGTAAPLARGAPTVPPSLLSGEWCGRL